MPTKYILIDFENVQPEIPAAWKRDNVKVKVFLGAKPKNLAAKFVITAQGLGRNLEYIEFSQQGKNALDSYITFYLGQLKQAEADAEFEIVSNDKGYDSLICHLKREGLRIARTGQAASQKVTAIRPEPKIYDPQVERVITNLRANPSKPRTVKALENSITSWLRNEKNPTEARDLVAKLQKARVVEITDTTVTYTLPKKPQLRVA